MALVLEVLTITATSSLISQLTKFHDSPALREEDHISLCLDLKTASTVHTVWLTAERNREWERANYCVHVYVCVFVCAREKERRCVRMTQY